ncbi:MAG: AAA family ATPase [Alphaproteobacteria bacterium]|nr:AAA family ATPase [Alphaproteobacteria bacterium]
MKPSNVLISDEGRVCVLDFGIGRYFSTSDTLSQSGEILGTVPYMAPEQLAGLPIDARIDIFAAATMLWECLCGKRPKPLTTIGWIPASASSGWSPSPSATARCRSPSRASWRTCWPSIPSTGPRPTRPSAASRPSWTAPRRPVWPTPPFADPGDWWTPLEAALGRQDQPSVWILEGPHGSGKRRIAEQLHRTGLMSGIWPIHLHCRVDAVGAPILQFLERITRSLDDASLARVIGEEGEMLRRMWPNLALAVGEGSEPPSTSEVAAAVTKVVRRFADHHPTLLVVHGLERVDTLTARTLSSLAKEASDTLGLVVLHENRWSTSLSRRTLTALTANGGVAVEVQPLTPATVQEIVTSLCPAAPPSEAISARTPHEACEIGWARLAAWRGEVFQPDVAGLEPLAVRAAPCPRSRPARSSRRPPSRARG